MKIRNGFVSNSSSSSFVIMTTKENHDKVLENIHPYIKAVIEAMNPSIGKLGDIETVSLGTMHTPNYGYFEDFDVEYEGDLPEGFDEDGEPYEAWDEYKKEIKKIGCITYSIDM